MRWSRYLPYLLVVPFAGLPPLLASYLVHPAPMSSPEREQAGLTLGADRARHVVVTSLQTNGPADHSDIAVGDRLRNIAGHPVTGLVMSRRLINDPARCDIAVSLDRAGVSHLARLRRCTGRRQEGISTNGSQDTARRR